MAATRTLSQFKSKLSGGGARPNLFEVSVPAFPSAIESAWGSGDDAENGLSIVLLSSTICFCVSIRASSLLSTSTIAEARGLANISAFLS